MPVKELPSKWNEVQIGISNDKWDMLPAWSYLITGILDTAEATNTGLYMKKKFPESSSV